MLVKTNIENYKIHNKKLLNLINKNNSKNILTQNEKISKTDWDSSNEENRPYVKYFIEMIRPYLDNLGPILHSKKWKIDNIWFQQYKKGDFHHWHLHSNSNFSAVYYVELPKEAQTKFYNRENIDLKEGDFILYPSFWYHRSEPLKNKRKTVIAFNCSFYEFFEK